MNNASRFSIWTVTIGFALVVVAMLVVGLVMVDKPHFGFLVNGLFLPIITSGVIVGSLVILAGWWKLPRRNSWRGHALLLWALIAVTSPLFGWLILAPWAVLVLTLPLIVAALVQLHRGAAIA